MSKLKQIINAIINPKRFMKLSEVSVKYQKAIDEAESKHKKDGHRYYVIFDPFQKKLISITYDFYKYRTDSYIYLRRRGRFGNPVTRNQLKSACYYYTASRNGAKKMNNIFKNISMMRLIKKM